MILEPDTRWCASVDDGVSRGVDAEISHWLESKTKHFLRV